MDMPTCKTCPYWVAMKGSVLYALDGTPVQLGECRWLPPLPRTEGVVTNERYWCGEHPDFPAYLDSLRVSGGVKEARS